MSLTHDDLRCLNPLTPEEVYNKAVYKVSQKYFGSDIEEPKLNKLYSIILGCINFKNELWVHNVETGWYKKDLHRKKLYIKALEL